MAQARFFSSQGKTTITRSRDLYSTFRQATSAIATPRRSLSLTPGTWERARSANYQKPASRAAHAGDTQISRRTMATDLNLTAVPSPSRMNFGDM